MCHLNEKQMYTDNFFMYISLANYSLTKNGISSSSID